MSRGVGRVCSCQGFGQKSSGRLGVPIGREQKIDRRAGGVKSPVQVPPFAFHSHIGLLDSDAVFPATLTAIHPCVRLLQSADNLLLMMSSSRHFSFLSCLQNSRKAKETVEFLETMKNAGYAESYRVPLPALTQAPLRRPLFVERIRSFGDQTFELKLPRNLKKLLRKGLARI
jgi:hypothetical protein